MSTYVYRSSAGKEIEADLPIGTAPKAITRGGVKYRRVYTVPILRELSPLDRGDKPSIAHSLPLYYGYGQRETVWKEHMEKLGIEDTPHRRKQVYKAGFGPKPKEIVRRSREAAIKAGAAEGFTKDGKVLARTKGAVQDVVARARDRGDALDWQ